MLPVTFTFAEKLRLSGKELMEEPLTLAQFKALFVKFTRDVLPEGELRRVADALANLEMLDRADVEKLSLTRMRKREPWHEHATDPSPQFAGASK